MGFDPWIRGVLWSRKQQPTAVFLPGKPHGRGAWWATERGAQAWGRTDAQALCCSGCHGTSLGCSSRTEAPASPAAGGADGWWPLAVGPLWALPSAEGSCLAQGTDFIKGWSRLGCKWGSPPPHSGQLWKAVLAVDLLIGLTEIFASTVLYCSSASLLTTSPTPPHSHPAPLPSAQLLRGVDFENSPQ